MLARRIFKPSSLWLIPLMVLLVIGVACGSSAEPVEDTTAPDAPPADTSAGDKVEPEPKDVPDDSGVMGAGEKVVVLIADVQDKVWFPPLMGGSDLKYGRMLYEDIFSGGGGQGILLPGIAKDWVMSDDAATWTVTIEEGIPFHNGEILDVDDVIYTLGMDRGDVSLRLLEKKCFEPRDTAYVKYTKSLEKGPGPDQFTYTQVRAAPNFPFNFSQNSQSPKALVIPKDYAFPMEDTC